MLICHESLPGVSMLKHNNDVISLIQHHTHAHNTNNM